MNHSIESDQFRPIPHVEPTAVVPNRFSPRRIGSLIAMGLALSSPALASAEEANVPAAQPEIPSASSNLSNRANQLIVKTAGAWVNHQLPDGRFVDPVVGTLPFGVPKTGQALVEAGVLTGNQSFISAGVKATVAEIKFPNDAGFNVGSEVAGMSSAFAWNERALAGNAEWQNARDDIAEFLQERSKFKVGISHEDGVKKCFENSNCYYNLKLVKALADIELKAAGINTSNKAKASSVNSSPHLSTQAILKQASNHTGRDAVRLGDQVNFEDAGILSDPPKNPLAYSAFSAMILARIVDRQGYENTPPSVKAMFERSARGLLGLMAPDGDVSYIGRGQGQVWNIAAAADAFGVAAKNSKDPVWRERYLAGVDRALKRLETVHTPNSWGLPLVPRLANDKSPDYKGLDRYANQAAYNGLALFALGNTVRSLSSIPTSEKSVIPADVNGVFLDPKQAHFAAVTKNERWWAVHGSTTHNDARYDFGIVAAQKKQPDGTWAPATPARPYTSAETSAGPVIVTKSEQYVPVSKSITANKLGVVSIKGGWAENPEKEVSLAKGTTWTFQPEKNGVSMSFRTKKTAEYQFKVWYEQGSKVTRTGRTLRVVEPDGKIQRYTLNRPMRIIKDRTTYSSAYDEKLRSTTISARIKAGKNVKYTTEF